MRDMLEDAIPTFTWVEHATQLKLRLGACTVCVPCYPTSLNARMSLLHTEPQPMHTERTPSAGTHCTVCLNSIGTATLHVGGLRTAAA